MNLFNIWSEYDQRCKASSEKIMEAGISYEPKHSQDVTCRECGFLRAQISYLNRVKSPFRSSMSVSGSTIMLVPRGVGNTATFRRSPFMPGSQLARNDFRSILSGSQSAHMSTARAAAWSGWGQKGRHLHCPSSSVAKKTNPSGPFSVHTSARSPTFDRKYRYLSSPGSVQARSNCSWFNRYIISQN